MNKILLESACRFRNAFNVCASCLFFVEVVHAKTKAATGKPSRLCRRESRLPHLTRLALMLVASFLVICTGCRSPGMNQFYGPPSRHSVRSERLVLLSNFRLPEDHALFRDLVKLRTRLHSLLQLPEPREDVVVYLFESQREYRQYLNATYPGLPDRRAYFVGTPSELAVYTYWGDRIQEDLRHESTHGLLHASLKGVPLWLDEGLAEYFETPEQAAGAPNGDYVQALQHRLESGWQPDLKRLEALTQFEDMRQEDYEEAWLWVHFLLHSSEVTRDVLLDYLHDLQQSANPRPLSTRLRHAVPQVEQRVGSYLATLGTTSVVTANRLGRGPHLHSRGRDRQ